MIELEAQQALGLRFKIMRRGMVTNKERFHYRLQLYIAQQRISSFRGAFLNKITEYQIDTI
jgi:hypothetical protein